MLITVCQYLYNERDVIDLNQTENADTKTIKKCCDAMRQWSRRYLLTEQTSN